MTQVFKDDGNVVPVTAVLAEPNVITQIKSDTNAVQIGMGDRKNIKKPQVGHLKDLPQARYMKEFRISSDEVTDLNRGDVISVATFEAGDKVKVVGVSKGKGFQGVVKRHGFHGSPASHGHKDQLRMGGSIGATDAARVFKGMRMPGQMGNTRLTVTGLEIVEVNTEKNIIFIKGAVPGARNGLLLISGDGELAVNQKKEEVKEVKKDIKSEKDSEEKVEVKEVKTEKPKAEEKTEEKIEKKEEVKVEEKQEVKEEVKEDIKQEVKESADAKVAADTEEKK